MHHSTQSDQREFVGIDLGDRYSRFCVLDGEGEISAEGRLPSTREGFLRRFRGRPSTRIVLETGTHSPWVDELLRSLGHEVFVANARKTRLIYSTENKTDRRDAELLARLGRADPKLLYPIKHRREQTRTDLEVIRARAALVRARTKLVNHVRGAAKSTGFRLSGCATKTFHKRVLHKLPEELRSAVEPIVAAIETLTDRIREYDRKIEALCKESYPETALLQQVHGVGPISSLCFVLTLEDPERFSSSRQVGSYLGLVPRRDQSGGRDPELGITKTGDTMLRTLLVQCAHYIIGPFGSDSDLRRHGLRIASAGKKNARKRAVVAVARKLAVLLHRLWLSEGAG